ncbi:MAG: hypothetical protein IBJ14_04325 [Hydrogenophaga sp.]|nr:hypothetical protein [Hydrogenophaga sp.]
MDRQLSGSRHHPPASSGSVMALLARFLGVAPEPRQKPRVPRLKDLMTIRQHLLFTIEDCMSVPAHRLRRQIEQARTPQELWLLRNDAFQLISQRHDQRTAAQRIDALIKIFEGWLDPKQLARIR